MTERYAVTLSNAQGFGTMIGVRIVILQGEMILLIDFGSTYTKLVVVSLADRLVVAQAQALTTVETDINLGLRAALAQLEAKHQLKPDRLTSRLACSSAAGGLKIVAIGLVKSLTVEAARQAALGAGARLIGAYSDRLNAHEIDEIVQSCPDMILLTGGTDGGDREVIQHNAALLAQANVAVPFVVAGNKEATPAAAGALRAQGKEVRITENVLPRLQEINVEPAREVIRQLFMERIVKAKGLAQAELFTGQVIMPTPAAVLHAARLLADGTGSQPGWGPVMVIDVGGATTDVHSVAPDLPREGMVIRRGIPEAYAKRTVEGDLGLRVSADAFLESVGLERLRAASGSDENDGSLLRSIRLRTTDVSFVATDDRERKLDDVMARLCVEIGTERHVGHLREHYLPTGFCYVQDGKDLTQVKHLIGTGGIFKYSQQAADIITGGLFDERKPFELKPVKSQTHVDGHYIVWAMGLLAQSHPDIALEILRKSLYRSPQGRLPCLPLL